MFLVRLFLLLFLFTFLVSCSKKTEEKNTLFQLLDTSETGIDFNNQVKESKEFNMLTYRNFFNGGGVAIGDINNDGLPDIYFTANQKKNKLYLNKGNLKFEDITDKAGVAGTKAWSTGVSMADVNGDGFLDIYVCNSGDFDNSAKENELFINNGNGTFTEKAKEFNLNNEGYGTHAAFFDFDLDGDLDCYLLNNSFKEPGKIELYRSMRDTPDLLGGDKLMRNDNGIFTDVTTQAGIYSSAIGFGLGVSTADINSDGLPDLYISNDFWERDYLYINKGNGTFSEDLTNRTDYISTSSMGADIADINGDGSPEIFTTDMLAAEQSRIQSMMIFEPYHIEDLKYRANYHYQFTQNCLQLNDGNGYFQEIANLAGISATDWSWGSLIFDFQNDGKNDIFVSNGIGKDILDGDFREFMEESGATRNQKDKNFDLREFTKSMPSTPIHNYAFVSKNKLQFEDQSDLLGLGQKSFSNGSAYADLDDDGDLDLVINNMNETAFVYQNKSSENKTGNYLKIRFKGKDKNPFGIGSKVILQKEDQIWVKENYTNRGFQSSIEPVLNFGLGENTTIDKLTIIWPGGLSEEVTNVNANQILVLDEINAKIPYTYPAKKNYPFVDISSKLFSENISHAENDFNDFNQEILLNRMLSTDSPRLIKGDVNKDGLEDFIMLGARNDADKLFLQTKNGSFISSNSAVFEKDKAFESTCGSFLDFEGDGDLDLLIGAGGNEPADPINFIVRLYLNDGSGNFAVDPSRIPPVVGNFSTLEVNDFDKNGYPDIFLGARCVVGSYGLSPKSYLIKNNGGQWQDVSPAYFSSLGMVTDAAWADYDKDGWDDLVLVGDWMPVNLLKNNQGNALKEPELVPNSSGWWTRVEASDLDNDGDLDFVLGNWGENTKFKTSAELPVNMKVADFDGNGKSEFIINWKTPDNPGLYPWASRVELTSQIPLLKKEKVKYSEFAKMKYEDLFPNLDNSKVKNLSCETLGSSILWNEGNNFTLEKLPLETQLAPVFAISIFDFNKDGKKDIFLAGNFYGLKPQLGRNAASKGLILLSKGERKFNSENLGLKGEFRDAAVINNNLILARNNQSLMAFSLK